MALQMAFPDVLVPALQTYLKLYRPRLMAMQGPRNPATAARPVGSHLWVSRCGTPMTEGALQKALARHTRARFGHHVNVHLFRDCLATSLADDNPRTFAWPPICSAIAAFEPPRPITSAPGRNPPCAAARPP
jgi:hypothetical protein